MRTATVFLAGVFLLAGHSAIKAQTYSSTAISTILSAGAGGYILPDGTTATAQIVATGSGTFGTITGQNASAVGSSIGGTYTGNTLPAYTGDNSINMLTAIQKKPDATIEGGRADNCKGSIGFWIHFSKPMLIADMLMLDIDGANTSPTNSEWTSVFGYNNTTFVPYTATTSGAGSELGKVTAFTNPNASWNTMIAGKIPGAQAVQSPEIWRCTTANGGTSQPDDVSNQVLFNPTNGAKVTDLFVLWGLWQQPGSPTTQASALGPIVVKAPTASLPLNLLSFTGVHEAGLNSLQWKTGDEVNTRAFDIEYSSNGKNFEVAGTVAAYGTGNHSYYFEDSKHADRNAYYRLKMIDNNGTYTYSRTIVLNAQGSNAAAAVRIWPNPVNSQLNIGTDGATLQSITIYDIQGKVVSRVQVGEAGSIDCSMLAAGVYFLNASDKEGNVTTIPFVKK